MNALACSGRPRDLGNRMTWTPASSSRWRYGPGVGPEQTRVEIGRLSSGRSLKIAPSEVPFGRLQSVQTSKIVVCRDATKRSDTNDVRRF
jgi:hypothetical protein